MNNFCVRVVKSFLFVLFLVLSFTLSGCGSGALITKDQLSRRLEAEQLGGYSIDSLSITERKTDRKNNQDQMWCELVFHDEESEYTRYYYAEAWKNTEGVWNVVETRPIDRQKWTRRPIAGVSEQTIAADLIGWSVTIGDDLWTADNWSKLSITQQDTDLSGLSDSVVVSVKLDDLVMKAEGALKLQYYYDEGWQLGQIITEKEFSASYKDGFQPELFKLDELTCLQNAEIRMDQWAKDQLVQLANYTVSDLSCLKEYPEEKGTCYFEEIQFNLYNENVSARAHGYILYRFENYEWRYSGFTADQFVLETLELSGTWLFVGDQLNHTMTFSELNPDGSFRVDIRATPKVTSSTTDTYSFAARGGIDFSTLEVAIIADYNSVDDYSTYNVEYGTFYLDSMKIVGVGIWQSGFSAFSFDVTITKQ